MDPKRLHYPVRIVCYPSMEREAAVGMYAALHEEAPFHDGSFQNWAKKRSAEHPYHFTDGVKVVVTDRDLAPWDTFTTDVNASPVRPEAGQTSEA